MTMMREPFKLTVLLLPLAALLSGPAQARFGGSGNHGGGGASRPAPAARPPAMPRAPQALSPQGAPQPGGYGRPVARPATGSLTQPVQPSLTNRFGLGAPGRTSVVAAPGGRGYGAPTGLGSRRSVVAPVLGGAALGTAAGVGIGSHLGNRPTSMGQGLGDNNGNGNSYGNGFGDGFGTRRDGANQGVGSRGRDQRALEPVYQKDGARQRDDDGRKTFVTPAGDGKFLIAYPRGQKNGQQDSVGGRNRNLTGNGQSDGYGYGSQGRESGYVGRRSERDGDRSYTETNVYIDKSRPLTLGFGGGLASGGGGGYYPTAAATPVAYTAAAPGYAPAYASAPLEPAAAVPLVVEPTDRSDICPPETFRPGICRYRRVDFTDAPSGAPWFWALRSTNPSVSLRDADGRWFWQTPEDELSNNRLSFTVRQSATTQVTWTCSKESALLNHAGRQGYKMACTPEMTRTTPETALMPTRPALVETLVPREDIPAGLVCAPADDQKGCVWYRTPKGAFRFRDISPWQKAADGYVFTESLALKHDAGGFTFQPANGDPGGRWSCRILTSPLELGVKLRAPYYGCQQLAVGAQAAPAGSLAARKAPVNVSGARRNGLQTDAQ